MKLEPFGPLDPALFRETVRRALAEDLGWGDVTAQATVAPEQRARGLLRAEVICVVAGLDVALEAFRQLDPGMRETVHRHDGTVCAAGDVLAEIEGGAQALLTAHRVARNFLERLSGIATLTRRFVDAAGGRLLVLDTRQTTPLLRSLEQYAVRAGGGANHRAALDDGVLIEAAHARFCGGIGEALRRARAAQPELPIEIELCSLSDVDEALEAGATRLRAVDFAPADLAEAVRRARGRAQVNVAGAMTVQDVEAIVAAGAESISVGALTRSPPVAAMAFELAPLA